MASTKSANVNANHFIVYKERLAVYDNRFSKYLFEFKEWLKSPRAIYDEALSPILEIAHTAYLTLFRHYKIPEGANVALRKEQNPDVDCYIELVQHIAANHAKFTRRDSAALTALYQTVVNTTSPRTATVPSPQMPPSLTIKSKKKKLKARVDLAGLVQVELNAAHAAAQAPVDAEVVETIKQEEPEIIDLTYSPTLSQNMDLAPADLAPKVAVPPAQIAVVQPSSPQNEIIDLTMDDSDEELPPPKTLVRQAPPPPPPITMHSQAQKQPQIGTSLAPLPPVVSPPGPPRLDRSRPLFNSSQIAASVAKQLPSQPTATPLLPISQPAGSTATLPVPQSTLQSVPAQQTQPNRPIFDIARIAASVSEQLLAQQQPATSPVQSVPQLQKPALQPFPLQQQPHRPVFNSAELAASLATKDSQHLSSVSQVQTTRQQEQRTVLKEPSRPIGTPPVPQPTKDQQHLSSIPQVQITRQQEQPTVLREPSRPLGTPPVPQPHDQNPMTESVVAQQPAPTFNIAEVAGNLFKEISPPPAPQPHIQSSQPPVAHHPILAALQTDILPVGPVVTATNNVGDEDAVMGSVLEFDEEDDMLMSPSQEFDDDVDMDTQTLDTEIGSPVPETPSIATLAPPAVVALPSHDGFPRLHIIKFSRGCAQSRQNLVNTIEFRIDMSEPFVSRLNLWKDRFTTQDDLSNAMCLTLGCYEYPKIIAAIPKFEQEASSKDWTSVFNDQLQSTWPTNCDLNLIGRYNDEQCSIGLHPPLMLTPENLFDLGPYITTQGKHSIQLSHHDDLAQFTFVLHAHPPTLAQLNQVVNVRQKRHNWESFLLDLSKPLVLPPSRFAGMVSS